MGNEDNSYKIAKEKEELKLKIISLTQEMHNKSVLTNSLFPPTNTSLINSKQNAKSLKTWNSIDKNNNNNDNNKKLKDHYDDLNPEFKISQINSHRISVEYLKNVLLKYLEAIAIGNEFQIKILENVIFSILKIPNSERQKLEDYRNRSSFYLNLWYNAKAYLAAKIYGNPNDAQKDENLNNLESFNFETDKNFIDAIQGSNNEINKGIIANTENQITSNYNINNANSINVNKTNINTIGTSNKYNLDKDLNGEDLIIDI